MRRQSSILAAALALLTVAAGTNASAQAVSYYYAPSPTVTYYAPSTATYSTSHYSPYTTYYSPYSSYYATAPTVSYYAPSVVSTPVYTAPAPIVRAKVYYPGQPVRNFVRAVTP